MALSLNVERPSPWSQYSPWSHFSFRGGPSAKVQSRSPPEANVPKRRGTRCPGRKKETKQASRKSCLLLLLLRRSTYPPGTHIDVVGSQAECDFSSDSASRQLGFDFFPELVRVIFFLGSAPLVDSRRSPPLLNPLLMPVRNCRRFRLGWIDRGLRFCSWIDSRTSLIFSSWE